MIGLDSLAAIALAFFIVTVSPGPANIAVATVAMSSGRRGGLLFGLGLSVGLAFWGWLRPRAWARSCKGPLIC